MNWKDGAGRNSGFVVFGWVWVLGIRLINVYQDMLASVRYNK